MVCWTIPPLSSPSYPFIGWSSIYRWFPVRCPSYEPKKSLNLDNLMVINWYVVLDWCSYNHGGKNLYIYILNWYVDQGTPQFFSMSHGIFPKARSWGGFWATPTVPKRRLRRRHRRRQRRERRQRGLDDGGEGENDGNLPWFGADDFWDILLLDKLSQIQEMW